MTKRFFIPLFLAAFTLFIACGDSDGASDQQNNTGNNVATDSAFGKIEDESKVEVTIVKYSDYQCPACKHFVPYENELKAEFGDRVKFEHKYFPLSGHQYAQLAARSAEAAKRQGKFAEMHTLIFKGQEKWSKGGAQTAFIGYAKEIGLDMDKFQEDMQSMDIQRKVMADKQSGLSKGVNATPTYFVNGDKIERTPSTYPEFKKVITSYLKD